MRNRKQSREFKFNKDNKAKQYIPLNTIGVEERTRELLTMYGQDYTIRNNEAKKENIKTEVTVCIARADSGLGTQLKTKHNYGNVGNDDRGTRVHFASPEQGIRAISKYGLNGRRLKRKQSIGDLSRAGNCEIDCRQYYATSKENREINLKNCLSNIHNKQIDHTFLFRIQ